MRHVLVVDDEPAIVRSYVKVLELYMEDYDVSAAATVQGAVATLESGTPFNVVLLDLSLGSEDSGALIPIIRRLCPFAGVALISGTPDAPRWLQVAPQCDIAIPKPVSADTLCQLVRRLETCRPVGLAELAEKCRLAQSECRVLEYAQSHPLETLQEIADALGIAKSTVQDYLQRIYDKTGIRSLRRIVGLLLSRAGDPRTAVHPNHKET